jgi:hypothetical protein
VYVREFLSLHKENVNQCKSSGGREGGKGGRGRARVCVREKRRAEERMKRGKREKGRPRDREREKTPKPKRKNKPTMSVIHSVDKSRARPSLVMS